MPTQLTNQARILTLVAIVLQIAGLLWAPVSSAADHQEKISRTFDARSGLVIELENLAGFIVLEGGGDEVLIEATVQSQGSQAKRLTQQLEVTFEERGDKLVVRAIYPTDEFVVFHYPGRGKGSGTTTAKYQGRRVKVTSRAKSGAASLWVDFRLRLPAGVGVAVDNTVGDVEAREVEGPFHAETGSGTILVSGCNGAVHADTGSGAVEVKNHTGPVHVDTGSGAVRVMAVVGNVNVDTGSGRVELEDVEGERILVDTGSGRVSLRQVRGEINADTGSGRVDGEGLVATGRLRVDTGSGGISLEGDFSRVDLVEIDAGSGGVELVGSLPAMDLEISTGSGGFDVDVAEMEVLERGKDELRARTRGGGVPVRIGTGSGRVQVREGS
jgi:hypothetical protein